MTIVYRDDVRSLRMEVVRAALDGGSISVMEGDKLVCSLPLTGGRVNGAKLSFTEQSATAARDGSPDSAVMLDFYGDIVVSGLSVGVEVGDVIVSVKDIKAGQTVKMMSATLRHF